MFSFLKSSKRVSNKVSKPEAGKRPMVEGLENRQLCSSGPLIYGASASGQLYRMNVGTGATQTIGQMPVIMYDIAVNKSSGQMFGVNSNGKLYKINKSNASVSYVGSLGRFANALTFGPDGRLYAAGYNKLMTVNTSNGSSTVIGTMGSNNSAGDLAFDGYSKLYLTTTSNKLVRINLTNHTMTTVGNLGFNQAYGLGFYNGSLYGFSNTTERAYKISTSTGFGTAVSFFGSWVNGCNGTSF